MRIIDYNRMFEALKMAEKQVEFHKLLEKYDKQFQGWMNFDESVTKRKITNTLNKIYNMYYHLKSALSFTNPDGVLSTPVFDSTISAFINSFERSNELPYPSEFLSLLNLLKSWVGEVNVNIMFCGTPISNIIKEEYIDRLSFEI